MATPNFTEEEILFRRRARRRLVGAVVLVVTVVAVVPMILPESKPQQDTQQIEIRIPAQDATGYAPKIQPAPAPVPLTPDNGAEKPVAVVPETASNSSAAPAQDKEPAKPETQPAPAIVPVKPTPAPATPAVATPLKASAAAKQTYFVQYGAFSEQKNAKQRQAELKAKGVSTFTEVVKTSAGDKIRVRSGPYTVRDEAEKIRVKVKPLDSKLVVTGNNP